MKKIGLYGGTFDPIHIGHLITARAVKEIRKLNEIIFVPANTSPLKLNVKSSSPLHRLEMTKLAVEKYPDFSVSDYEINNTDVSYTYNTIKHFIKEYKDIDLIIGYDNYLLFDKWYKWEEILELVNVVVLRRFYDKQIEPKIAPDKFIFVESPTIQINSTMIRKRVADNLPIDLLVTQEVLDYIKKEKLYLTK